MGVIAVGQRLVGDRDRATDAFGHVLTGHLDMDAASVRTFGPVRGDGRLAKAVETFLALFHRNRQDKSAFMTGAMEAYFRDLIQALDREGLLRLCILDVAGQSAAAVLCFDYQGVRYLYNSGYDERFQALSVGILCKILSIRQGIEMGCRHYDFLKGAEEYKRRIGGREVALHGCALDL